MFTIRTYISDMPLISLFFFSFHLKVAGGGTMIGRHNPPNTPNPLGLGIVATFVYIFAMFYSPGEGPVPFTYSAEVFPLAQREQGMAWAVTVCLGFAALLSITLFKMLVVFQVWGTFFFYAGLNVSFQKKGFFFLFPGCTF